MAKYLGQSEAIKLDDELMGLGFISEQLMELAGLSCAIAITKFYDKSTHSRIFIVCGPGNNGGDGLVCARHLTTFGYQVHLYYPKRPDNTHLKSLTTQCNILNITFLNSFPEATEISKNYDLVVDAIFGLSFKGEIRNPFDVILDTLNKIKIPIAAIDIPSGWDTEKGNITGKGLSPELLISLSVPKLCAKFFTGKYHILGGRFIPKIIANKYELNLPEFPGTEQVVIL